MKCIAVYGSLKKDRYNHPIIQGSEYLGTVDLVGTMYAVSSYPALLDEGKEKYEAEVYRVSDDVYDRVDSMELGAGYKRMTARMTGKNGEAIEATVYYADDSLAEYCKKNKQVISSY